MLDGVPNFEFDDEEPAPAKSPAHAPEALKPVEAPPVAEDLAASENADEKKAADGFAAMLAAFPDGWRKRRDSNPR